MGSISPALPLGQHSHPVTPTSELELFVSSGCELFEPGVGLSGLAPPFCPISTFPPLPLSELVFVLFCS